MVAWGVVAVLLCVLWVRSYWRTDTITLYQSNADYIDFGAHRGIIAVSCTTEPSLPKIRGIQIESGYHANPGGILGFYVARTPAGIVQLKMPTVLVVILSVAIASASWLSWHFSLRTLLIATTLVAVVLGIIVWVSRAG